MQPFKLIVEDEKAVGRSALQRSTSACWAFSIQRGVDASSHMPTFPQTHPSPVVEKLAQRWFRLESLMEEQSAVIRKEPGGYQAAYERNLYDVVKPRDRWIPADAAEKERNIKKMEEICAKVPSSIDE
jgi:hypothetical protein